jgi:two-component system sensor histidine kinase HydH
MSRTGYLLVGLSAMVSVLASVLTFAFLKFFAAARSAARDARTEGTETEFMASAMEDALATLRSKERAMKARAEASERLSSEIVANLTSGLLVVTEEAMVRTMNPAGRKLLGLPEADWNRPITDVLANAAPLAAVIEECLQSSRPIVRRALQMSQPSGGATYLGVSVSPIHDEANGLRGAICLFTDLSQVMDLEEQLRLKDSLARLGELTAGIAHEFRNGLATIHGYARLLDLNRLSAEFRPYVQGIRDETDAMGQVVTNFLNFARPTEMIVAPVDMRAIAERAADEIRSDVRARGGAVQVRGEFGEVEGDEVLLRQAFSNLCRNALEACTPATGPPQITLEGLPDLQHGVLRVTVTDNGPGIDAAVADRMFRPFVTTKAQGSGLGLALVQKIVVTHNGRVAAAAADTGGARLSVTLPLRSVPAGASVPAARLA